MEADSPMVTKEPVNQVAVEPSLNSLAGVVWNQP